jgi:hypothetical protein
MRTENVDSADEAPEVCIRIYIERWNEIRRKTKNMIQERLAGICRTNGPWMSTVSARFCRKICHRPPLTVAALSKAWTLFARSNTGIVDSNPTQGMDVCVRLLHACVVLCVGSGLASGWSPVQGVLPTVYRMKRLQKRPGPNKGL